MFTGQSKKDKLGLWKLDMKLLALQSFYRDRTTGFKISVSKAMVCWLVENQYLVLKGGAFSRCWKNFNNGS